MLLGKSVSYSENTLSFLRIVGGMGAVTHLHMSLLEVWIKKIHKNHSDSSIQGAEFVTVCDKVPLPVNS